MAQLVEQRIRNAWVAGSSPASGSEKTASAVFFSSWALCTLQLAQFVERECAELSRRNIEGIPKEYRGNTEGISRVITDCCAQRRLIAIMHTMAFIYSKNHESAIFSAGKFANVHIFSYLCRCVVLDNRKSHNNEGRRQLLHNQ